MFKIAHLPKKNTARAPKRESQGRVSQRRCGQFISTRKAVQTAEAARKEMADGNAQTAKESQPRVTAKADNPNKLNPFNHFQLFCPRPICPGGRQLSFAQLPNGSHTQTNRSSKRDPLYKPAGKSVDQVSIFAQTTAS